MMPTETLKKPGGPKDWLGFDRYNTEFAPTEWEVKTAEFSGPLRGVKEISWARLQRALSLKAERVGDGKYKVYDPNPKGNRKWWHLVFNPEPGPLTVEDTVQYVDLKDPYNERCYCRDMQNDSETSAASLGTPCKHMLAALIEEGHPTILELVEELKRRNAIAAAASKEVTL